MIDVRLSVVGGDARPTEVSLKLPTVIGRGRDVTLTLPHPLVSRRHCELFERDGQLFVKDLNSLNGTYVNNLRIQGEHVIEPNQLLTIGNVTFRALYETSVLASHTDTQPVHLSKTEQAIPERSTQEVAERKQRRSLHQRAAPFVKRASLEETHQDVYHPPAPPAAAPADAPGSLVDTEEAVGPVNVKADDVGVGDEPAAATPVYEASIIAALADVAPEKSPRAAGMSAIEQLPPSGRASGGDTEHAPLIMTQNDSEPPAPGDSFLAAMGGHEAAAAVAADDAALQSFLSKSNSHR